MRAERIHGERNLMMPQLCECAVCYNVESESRSLRNREDIEGVLKV